MSQVEEKPQEEKEQAAEPEDKFPKAMSTLEDAGAARKRIKIDIPAERIKGKLAEAFEELHRDAVLPGFRRGRAPSRLIEKRFGADVRNSVKQQLVSEAYQQALETHKLEALGEPEIDLAKISLPDGGNLEVSVEVEVAPEFELPSIENIAVKKPILEATEARLDLAVDNLRKYFGHWHDTGKPSTDADTLGVDVKITGDNNAVIAEQANVSLAVKSEAIAGMTIANLEQQLASRSIGDTVTIDAPLPGDHPDEAMRGKSVHLALTVKSVKHQDLPEVNQEFATMLGFDSIEELRADLKERLVVQLEQETKGALAQQIYRYLLSNTNLDLPAKLSQKQMGNVLRRRATDLMQRGIPESEIVQQIDQLRISSAQQAAVDLRLFFILSKLAEQFGIEVGEEEVNSRIATIAAQYGRRPEKLRSQMAGSGQLEQLYLQIRDGKVVDKLVEMGTVTEVDEKTLAEEFKNLPPLTNIGPIVTAVSHSAPAKTAPSEPKADPSAT